MRSGSSGSSGRRRDAAHGTRGLRVSDRRHPRARHAARVSIGCARRHSSWRRRRTCSPPSSSVEEIAAAIPDARLCAAAGQSRGPDRGSRMPSMRRSLGFPRSGIEKTPMAVRRRAAPPVKRGPSGFGGCLGPQTATQRRYEWVRLRGYHLTDHRREKRHWTTSFLPARGPGGPKPRRRRTAAVAALRPRSRALARRGLCEPRIECRCA